MGEDRGMAKPIDPNRWKEFPARRPPKRPAPDPAPAGLPEPGNAAVPRASRVGSEGGRQRVGPRSWNDAASSGWVVGDFGSGRGTQESPVEVVACIVGQLAAHVDAELNAPSNGGIREGSGRVSGEAVDVQDPRVFAVESDGHVKIPQTFASTGPALLELFAELIGNQPVPPMAARLLLSRSAIDCRVLATTMNSLGTPQQVAEFLTAEDDVPRAEDRSRTAEPDGAMGLPKQRSPTAARSRSTSSASSAASPEGTPSKRGRSHRVLWVGAGVAIALLLVVGLIGTDSDDSVAAEAMASSQPVQGPSARPSSSTQTPPSTSTVAVTPTAGMSTAAVVEPGVQVKSIGPAAHPTSWAALVAKLDSARARAFEVGKSELLQDVNVPGSPAAVADAQVLADLQEIGAVARGVRSTITDVRVMEADSAQVLLAVTDELAGYEVVTVSDESVIEVREPRPSASWEVTLRATAGQWRIYSSESA